ncbi:hypothetical protein D3C77_608250 [compost metagenome]
MPAGLPFSTILITRSSSPYKPGCASTGAPPASRIHRIASSGEIRGNDAYPGLPSAKYRSNASRKSAAAPILTSVSAICGRPRLSSGRSSRPSPCLTSTSIISIPSWFKFSIIRSFRNSLVRLKETNLARSFLSSMFRKYPST